MSCLTTILRGLPGLVVALLMALVGSRGDVWLGAACGAVTTNQIAVAQTARSSAPSTPVSISRPPRNELLSASELEEDAELDELEERREGCSAFVLPSVRVDLEARSKGRAGAGWDERGSNVRSHGISTGHPRGPPAARLG